MNAIHGYSLNVKQKQTLVSLTLIKVCFFCLSSVCVNNILSEKIEIYIEVIYMSLHDLIENAEEVDLFPEFKEIPWYKRCMFEIRVKVSVMLCEIKYALFRR